MRAIVPITPDEAAILDQLRGSIRRGPFATSLLRKLIFERFGDPIACTLPSLPAHGCRHVSIKTDDELSAALERWEELDLDDAVRIAIRTGASAQKDSDQEGLAHEDPNAVELDEEQGAPEVNAEANAGPEEASPIPRSRSASRKTDKVIAELARRVRRRQRADGGHLFGDVGPDIEVCSADDRATNRLLRRLDRDGEVYVAEELDADLERTLGGWFADLPERATLRLLVGAVLDEDQDVAFCGVPDPGGVAEELGKLAKRIGRSGEYRIRPHWIETELGLYGITEVSARLD